MVYMRCKPCTGSLHIGRLNVQHPLWVLCSLCIPQAVLSFGAPGAYSQDAATSSIPTSVI